MICQSKESYATEAGNVQALIASQVRWPAHLPLARNQKLRPRARAGVLVLEHPGSAF
jgi:hypothetical protein